MENTTASTPGTPTGVPAPAQILQVAPVGVPAPAVATTAMPQQIVVEKKFETMPVPPATLPADEIPVPAPAEDVLKKALADLAAAKKENEALAGGLKKQVEEIRSQMAAAQKEKETASVMEQLRKIPGINPDLITADLVEKGIFPVEAGKIKLEVLQAQKGFFMPGTPTYLGQPIQTAPQKMDAGYWLQRDYGINMCGGK
jgi:hypothetical protein